MNLSEKRFSFLQVGGCFVGAGLGESKRQNILEYANDFLNANHKDKAYIHHIMDTNLDTSW